MIKYLIICLSLVSGCSHTHTRIGLPPGPNLEPISQEMWEDLTPRMKTVLSQNGAEWEIWYDKVTSRIQIHDEAMN